MAITGPFEEYRTNSPGDREYRYWYRGGRATGTPLAHIKRKYVSTAVENGVRKVGDNLQDDRAYRYSWGGYWPPEMEALYAQAYDRLLSKSRDKVKASVGVSLIEMGESLAMIHRRATQLADFTSALRRRNFGGVVRALGLAKDETLRLGKRSARVAREDKTRLLRTTWDKQSAKPAAFANNYLEIVFGWAPLVNDIQDAMKVLSREFPVTPIWGRKEETVSTFVDLPFIAGSQLKQTYVYKQKCAVRLQATVRVNNPNIVLANQLGLVNLAEVAWNVVPFSFIIGWFLPVGRYLESYSDFAGMTLQNAFVSRVCEVRGTRLQIDYQDGEEVWRRNEEHLSHQFRRELKPNGFEIPSFRSRIQLPGGDLLGKASSSVALLIQQLSNRK